MRLEISGLVKRFGDKEVLHGVSFAVESGRALGFLGRNGAGKSTTIRCAMEVFRQDEGDILLDGKPFHAKKHRVGYLPEERGMYAKAKVLDQLVYFARLRGPSKPDAVASAKQWLDYFGLTAAALKPLEQLSKGNQQKVQIAQSLLNDPDLLILDEPFSGLDPVNAQAFKDAIRDFVRRGKLVIFSSHQMGYVEEMCDDIALIDAGSIVLRGDLKQLLLERSQNRWALSARDNGALAAALVAAFPAARVENHKDGLIFNAGKALDQPRLFRLLADAGLSLERFERWTPTLNDLFIQAVGGEKA